MLLATETKGSKRNRTLVSMTTAHVRRTDLLGALGLTHSRHHHEHQFAANGNAASCRSDSLSAIMAAAAQLVPKIATIRMCAAQAPLGRGGMRSLQAKAQHRMQTCWAEVPSANGHYRPLRRCRAAPGRLPAHRRRGRALSSQRTNDVHGQGTGMQQVQIAERTCGRRGNAGLVQGGQMVFKLLPRGYMPRQPVQRICIQGGSRAQTL